MKDIILHNERYGVIEIDNSGIIICYNDSAVRFFSALRNDKFSGNIAGMNVKMLSDESGGTDFNPEVPEKFFGSINGIKIIDIIPYEITESAIVRFALSNETFTPFFDAVKLSPAQYLELDNELNVIFASEAFFRNSGYRKPEIYGLSISAFSDEKCFSRIISASELCRNRVVDAIRVNDVQFSLKNIHYTFDLEVSSFITGNTGMTGIFLHLIDTSFERKCRQMNSTVRRMSAVANFAGGIAHDYNNALTAVLGNISLAKMDAEKGSELDELLRDAESAALKIKSLTERLGMFSRGMKPVKVKTDMRQLIENLVPEVFVSFKGRYSITFSDNIPYPEIDQDLISEAVRHVFENAVDAADQQSGEVHIRAEETDVISESVFREISLVPGKYILISVKDNGPGLEDVGSGEIFDPYVTTKPGREGLGLALTYSILKRHRGFISAGASENGGAEFKIYLPLF